VVTTLQWPNDLLLRDRKLAGILCQSRVTATTARVACGVGINVHRLAGAGTVIEPAPAFCDEVAPVDRAALLVAILRTYDATLAALDDPVPVIRDWEAAAEIPGRRYRIAKDNAREPFEAIAQSLDQGGGLRVLCDDGSSERVEMADARVLR
jgi:BirA family biotin operon repressor/biotin-[acetyl-CoA-carboxylase] ligase